jgi:hypothetical protein
MAPGAGAAESAASVCTQEATFAVAGRRSPVAQTLIPAACTSDEFFALVTPRS